MLLLLLLLLAERIVGRRGDVLAVRRVWGRAEHRLSVEKGSPRKRSLHGRGTRTSRAAGTILPIPASYQAQ